MNAALQQLWQQAVDRALGVQDRLRQLPPSVRRLGWPAPLGLVLALLAWWAQTASLPAMREDLNHTQQAARKLRFELKTRLDLQAQQAAQRERLGVHIDPNAAPREIWSQLWQQLPRQSQRYALQHQVLDSARQAGITLSTVSFHGELQSWTQDHNSKDSAKDSAKESGKDSASGTTSAAEHGAPAAPSTLWREQLQMPVQTTYTNLRAWLQSLQQQPALSIDALDIERTDPMSEQVKAQISVSLWWRQGGAQP